MAKALRSSSIKSLCFLASYAVRAGSGSSASYSSNRSRSSAAYG
jgi:hypothetical protein